MQRLARLSRLRPTTHFETARYATSMNPSPGAIRVQKVQFFKPRRGMVRPLRLTLWFCAFYMAGSFAIDALLEDIDDEDYEDVAPDPEESQRVTFIPLPFTEKKVIPPPYEKGCPEWLAFKKISESQERMTKLRKDLAFMAWTILANPSSSPSANVFASMYGRPIGLHTRLSVQFPSRPPPEWSQKGLVFNDGEIALAVRQPADSKMIEMLQRALRPMPLAAALWRYTKTITQQTYDSIVGSSDSPAGGASPHGLIITAETSDGRRTQVTLPIKPQIDPPSSSAPPNGGGPIQASHQQATPSPDGPSKTSDTPDLRSRVLGGVPASGFGGVFPPTAWNQLVQDVRAIANVHPAHKLPPRGVVLVSGQAYVETTMNHVTLQVAAWWDPKTEKYQMPPLEMSVKEITPKVSQFL